MRSLTEDNPHQLVIDKQLAKAGAVWRRGQVVKLLDTQLALVEACEGTPIILSFGVLAWEQDVGSQRNPT